MKTLARLTEGDLSCGSAESIRCKPAELVVQKRLSLFWETTMVPRGPRMTAGMKCVFRGWGGSPRLKIQIISEYPCYPKWFSKVEFIGIHIWSSDRKPDQASWRLHITSMGQNSLNWSSHNIWKEQKMKLPTQRFGFYRAGDKNVRMMLFVIEADR